MNRSESKYFNTARRFDEAMIALLEKKPFSYITIREICQQAGVNRSTFYLHYETLGDLLEETTGYLLTRFYSCFPADQRGIEERALDELDFLRDDYLGPYLTFIKENRRVFCAVLSQQRTFNTDQIFRQMLETVFRPILDRFRCPQDRQHYVMLFYLNGVTAVVSEWLRQDCRETIPEIARIIRSCVPAGPF